MKKIHKIALDNEFVNGSFLELTEDDNVLTDSKIDFGDDEESYYDNEEEVYYPSYMWKIGNSSISITIPDSVVNITNKVFDQKIEWDFIDALKIPKSVRNIDSYALSYLKSLKRLSIYGVELCFNDLWENTDSKYYKDEYCQRAEANRDNYNARYGSYHRDELECNDDDEEDDEKILAVIYNAADQQLVQNILSYVPALINRDFEKCILYSDTEDCDSFGLPEKFAFDVVKAMTEIYPDDENIWTFLRKLES